MVNENWKIGVEIEVDPESLADITKQVEKAVKAGVTKGSRGAGAGAGAAPRALPPVGGGAATARSIRDAAKVSSADFTRAVASVAAENKLVADKFDSAAGELVTAITKLTRTLQARPAAARPGGDPSPLPSTDRMVSRTAGPSGKALAKNIVAGRKEGGRQEVGGQTERRQDKRTGTPRDNPANQQSAEKRVASRFNKQAKPIPQQAFAKSEAKAVAISLDRLGRSLEKFGALGNIPDLRKKINLPRGSDVSQGPGASTVVKTVSGLDKTVTKFVQMAGLNVTKTNNMVSEVIDRLAKSPQFRKTVQTAEGYARKDPDRATALLRRTIGDNIKEMFSIPGIKDLPATKLKGAGAYQKGGEALFDIKLDQATAAKINSVKNETDQIALFIKMLNQSTSALKQLADRGMDVVGLTGLSEETAAKSRVIKDRTTGKVTGIELRAQTRPLAQLNLGGAGGMRMARSFQPAQSRPMVGGEDPNIVGRGEARAYETGIFSKKMARNLKTAFLDPRRTPEVHEDMILVDAKAAKSMSMWEDTPSQIMKERASGLRVGQKLKQGQVIGTDIEGRDVKFDMKGVDAEIEAIEEVMEDGISGVRLRFKELFELQTGSKITTTGGFKGVVKVEKDMAKKYGLAKGTQVAVSGQGMAKRGILGDPMKMVASEIAGMAGEGVSGQQVADVMENAMRQGGKDIVEAARIAAEGVGVKDYTGAQAGSKIKAFTGELPWQRLGEPKIPGPGDIKQQYHDLPAMRALSGRADTQAFAKNMMEDMDKVRAKQEDYRATLRALAGETDVAAENLDQMLPEQFKSLPESAGAKETYTGTLLDPAFAKAMAIRMPTRGGGEELLRLPEQGTGLGRRMGFEKKLGSVGADPIARVFDKMLQKGRDIRMAEGRIPADPLGSADQREEAGYRLKDVLGDKIAAIFKRSQEGDPQAGAEADALVNSIIPVMKELGTTITEPLKFFYLNKKGERKTKYALPSAEEGASAAEFIGGRKGAMKRLTALQAVLVGRPGGKFPGGVAPGPGGKKFDPSENLPSGGQVWKDGMLLNKAMEALGITMQRTAPEIETLYGELDGLREKALKMLAVGQGMGSSTSDQGRNDPRLLPYAQTMGAGLATTQSELTAVQFRTNIGDELAEARASLLQLAEAGKNVDESLAALDRMSIAQGEVAKIPRDAVFMNKVDYENLVKATMKQRGIGRG